MAMSMEDLFKKGEHEKAVSNATTMLKDGLDIEKTSLYSGLPREEVIALSKQIKSVTV